jgi:excisionase family DNA binding protein
VNNRLLRGEEVAEELGISTAYAYRLMATGAIQTVKMGRAVRVRQEDLLEFIMACRNDQNSQSMQSEKKTMA